MARQLRAGDRFFRGKQVRLLAEDNTPLGIVSFEEAVSRAERAGLDLVEVANNATPPVCRIMDYGKQLYEQSKRQREANKKQIQHKLKEIKFHPNIDRHDYETKMNHAFAFLEKGCKVKVSMFFRGREMAHTELGHQLMQRVVADVADRAIVESSPRQSGRMIAMLLAPKGRK